MKVLDQETGKTILLYPTEELEQDISQWHANVCSHPGSQVVLATYSNGAKHFLQQCVRCGHRLGSPIKKANAPGNAPDEDLQLQRSYEEGRTKEYDSIILKHLQIQKQGDSTFTKRYAEYLKSPKWAAKREKVLQRDRHICQGCLERKATQAHHTTYEHVFEELLFELISLCTECHKRCHPSDEPIEFVAFGDESPCDGCRWQTENDSGREMCAIFDAPASRARAQVDMCGPRRTAFEPLR